MRIALIAPPWQLFNRPSIQIAALKAFLVKNNKGVSVRAFHPYLDVAVEAGFDNYLAVSRSGWASEAMAAGALYPEMAGRCDMLFRREMGKKTKNLFVPDPGEMRKAMIRAINLFLARVPWEEYALAGITSSLNQLTASLLIAREIRKRAPRVPIVLGGSGCSGRLGRSLLPLFPQIDYVINGEGERPLSGLIQRIMDPQAPLPAGVMAREIDHDVPGFDQMEDLDGLPVPDFDDFFRDLAAIPPEKRFFPILPVEYSRGCWWGRCAFCNLNLQWKGYRKKTVRRMAREIHALAVRHGSVDFAFMDNSLPRWEAAPLFRELAGHGRDYSFFAEIRAVHSGYETRIMSSGGLREAQVGIEALSTSLLKRLEKGLCTVDNIAAMRHAEECGIALSGNLILHFPGSTEEEARETMRALDFVWPYRPLKGVSFWLGAESPVYRSPGRFGVGTLRPHPYYADLFPQKVIEKLSPPILGYRGDVKKQRKVWKDVENRLKAWERARAKLPAGERLLTYRDGKECLIIRQVLPGGEVRHHRLTGLSRRLYLACCEITGMKALEEMADGRTPAEVEGFVNGLVAKRLMFREKDHVLSLAIGNR